MTQGMQDLLGRLCLSVSESPSFSRGEYVKRTKMQKIALFFLAVPCHFLIWIRIPAIIGEKERHTYICAED